MSHMSVGIQRMIRSMSLLLLISACSKTSAFCIVTTKSSSLSLSTNEYLRIFSTHHERQMTSICATKAKGVSEKDDDKDDSSDKETSNTFRKVDFISAVANKTGMNKKESEVAMKAVLDVITEQVKHGKRVNLPSFGTFTLKQRAARKGRNPQTGEPLDIAASKSPSFTPAKAWKDLVNE